MLENVQRDFKGDKAAALAQYLRLCKSEGRDLVEGIDWELKQKLKETHLKSKVDKTLAILV